MMAFMDYKSAKEYYSLNKEEHPDTTEEYSNFYPYYKNYWLSLENSRYNKYVFNLWIFMENLTLKELKKLISKENM